MIRMKGLLLGCFLLSMTALGQSHLHFNYRIDAAIFSDDSALYFIAHEYPVFQAHPEDAASKRLEERFAQGNPITLYQQLEQLKELTYIQGMEVNGILDPAALYALMKNRMGWGNGFPQDTAYLIQNTIHRIEFPNNQDPYFNHTTLRAERLKGNKRFDQSEMLEAVNWKTGERLTLGELTRADTERCLKDALHEDGAKHRDCSGTSFDKLVLESNICDLPIRQITLEEAVLHVDPVSVGCLSTPEWVRLTIPSACFSAEGSCKP